MTTLIIIIAVIVAIAFFARFKAKSAIEREIDIYTRSEVERMNKTEKN